MSAVLAAQVVVAVDRRDRSASSASTSGQLNALAFGVLVPMFGIGLNGLWARAPRLVTARATDAAAERPNEPSKIG